MMFFNFLFYSLLFQGTYSRLLIAFKAVKESLPFIVFICLYIFLKSFTLAGLASFVLIPFLSYIFYQNVYVLFMLLIIIGLIFYTHRKTIKEKYEQRGKS